MGKPDSESDMTRRMSSMVGAAGVALTLLMLALPAQAKGPSRVTIAGPGIEGEVDMIEGKGAAEGFGWWFPYDLMAEPLTDAPTGALGEAYLVTWYSVRGAAHWEDKPEPMVYRVAYYPDVEAVQVLEVSEGDIPGGSGWHRVDPAGAFSFSEGLVRVREDGLVGAASYIFVTEGTGRGARAEWVAQPIASSGGSVPIGPILVSASGVLLGLGVWTRLRPRPARRQHFTGRNIESA